MSVQLKSCRSKGTRQILSQMSNDSLREIATRPGASGKQRQRCQNELTKRGVFL